MRVAGTPPLAVANATPPGQNGFDFDAHRITGAWVDGEPRDADGNPAGGRTLYNADVEPDADGDLYGDETQDACPTNAAIQTACPPVVQPVFASARNIRSAGRGRRIAVDVVCPSGRAACEGSVFARSSRRLKLAGRGRRALKSYLSFGEKSYTVASNQRKTLSFSLTRGERALLQRLRRIRVTVTLVPTDTRLTRLAGTVRAPKRKRG